MRNSRALLIIGVALLLALGAVLLAARLMSDSGGATRIVVATVDIAQGSRVTPVSLQLVEWPASSIPAGAFSDLKLLEERVARIDIGRGEPLTESKLSPPGAMGGLSSVVAAGKRAMTVRVNDVVGVAGFALPGNFVDILVNMEGSGGDNGGRTAAISKIVLERILVLAIDKEANRDDTKPRVVNAVTLELTPDQVEKLDLARSIGSLSLVLRNQVDPQPANTGGATRESVLGLPAIQAAAKSTPVSDTAPRVISVSRPVIVKPAPQEAGVLVIRGLDAAPQAAH